MRRPEGGTLVLLHTHQNLIRQVLGQNQGRINEKISTVYEKLGAKDRGRIIMIRKSSFRQAGSNSDPLDDFVVLGDFCIPYLCCDTDCSDIVLKRNPKISFETASLPADFSDASRHGRTAPAAPEKDRHFGDQCSRLKNRGGQNCGEAFSFSAPAGLYRIDVKNRGYVNCRKTDPRSQRR